MDTAPVGIDAVPKGDIRGAILGDDGLRGIFQVLDLAACMLPQVLLIPFHVLKIGVSMHPLKTVRRIELRAMAHDDDSERRK